MASDDKGNRPPKKIVFFINHTKHETTEGALTPRVMLRDFAKEDPSVTTLAHRHGNSLKRLESLDEPFPLENGMHFVVFHETPVTVS